MLTTLCEDRAALDIELPPRSAMEASRSQDQARVVCSEGAALPRDRPKRSSASESTFCVSTSIFWTKTDDVSTRRMNAFVGTGRRQLGKMVVRQNRFEIVCLRDACQEELRRICATLKQHT